MYFKVSYTLQGKRRNTEKWALFTSEAAAKKFQDQLWNDKNVIHAEVQAGFNSKGEKV